MWKNHPIQLLCRVLWHQYWFNRFLSKIALVGLLGLAIASCSVTQKPVFVAGHIWLGYEPLFLAQREGWLDKKQVKLIETKSATESMQALLDGTVDGAMLTLDEALTVRSNGLPVSVVMVFNMSAGADVLLVNSSIKKLTDLKGKRLGVESSSVGEIMLTEILSKANLKRQELNIIPMRYDQHINAWKQQKIDALITYEPKSSVLVDLGANKLFDSRQMPNAIVDVLVFRTDRLSGAHHQAIKHLISSHFKALAYFTHNATDASYRMAKHLQMDAHDVLPAYKGLVLPSKRTNYSLLANTPPDLLPRAESLAALMHENHLIKRKDDLSPLIHGEFLPKDFVEDVN